MLYFVLFLNILIEKNIYKQFGVYKTDISKVDIAHVWLIPEFTGLVTIHLFTQLNCVATSCVQASTTHSQL